MRTEKLLTMKKIFTLLLLFVAFATHAQQFNNEWIRHNQTYYKFKVGAAGVYRIPKAALDAAGIGNTQVQFFELWRNGEPVPFYPSVMSGTLPADGYIEFWGKPNDGKPDAPMYREPAFQHTKNTSLLNDTAVYFLSINTNQSGFMIFDAMNDVSSNTLPVEPYFTHTVGSYYRARINPGLAAVVGEYVYSSSYDKGEFWSTAPIAPSSPITTIFTNLFAYSGGPDATFRFGASGNALNPRSVRASINSTVVLDTAMDYFNDVHANVTIPSTLLSGGNANVVFQNTSPIGSDRMVLSYAEITYPRQFNFEAKRNFEFTLPADNDGYYLEITNFNNAGLAPVLYDLTFGSRYVGDISTPGTIKFVLPASTSESKYVLVSQEATNVVTVSTLTQKNFVKFSDVANQGNYLIISHPMLNNGTQGRKPLDEYSAYRASAVGGGFNTKIIDIDELVDQFAFGIRKHPLSVRNFIRYARATFAQPVQNVFLIGRGMVYSDYRVRLSDTLIDRLNIIPTFGNPGSDNMLSAGDVTNPTPITPIGRLSVVVPRELEDYLEKVKEYESAQQTAPNTLAGREWMKNVVHITGASDPYLGTVLCNYMGVYKQIIEDTLFGGHVTTFCKTSVNPVEQLTTEKLEHLFEEGISILTYFGHSSSTTLEFNLDNPQSYNNPGKYPVFFVNGCNAGNFFTYYPQRFQVNETLSEKFTLAKQRGSIAFVASTHYGIVNYLNIFLNNLYGSITKTDYGATLGDITRLALEGLVNATGPYDYYARMHAEEITLHGDPALKLNVQPKPDYVIEEPSIKINPTFISIAENSFDLKVRLVNLGKALGDSVRLEIKRQYPDGTSSIIYNKKVRNVHYADSVTITVPIIATRDKGTNKIFATIDSDFKYDEMSESNNVAVKEFVIYEDEARPVYPYTYSIINNQAQKMFASTANPLSKSRDYVMEMDTTEKFNSPLKITKTVTSAGGVLEFNPGITFLDSTVYYWRVATVPFANGEYKWNNSSFVYINGPYEGFNQSHYFQHTKSGAERMSYDSVTRKLKYGTRSNNLFFRNGVYPFSGSQDNDFSITVNGETIIKSACVGRSLIFNVFDPITFKPWLNVDENGVSLNRFGSGSASCAAGRRYNFEFSYMTPASRKLMMDFMDSIPTGYIVTIKTVDTHNPNSLSATWRGDTTLYGSNNSLYHKLLAAGFVNIDSLNHMGAWVGMYRKGGGGTIPQFKYSAGLYDPVVMSVDVHTPDTLGVLTSPKFGPAKQWNEVIWRGESMETPSEDRPTIDVIGVDTANNETLLYTLDKYTQNFDISSVDANMFPYMKLRMHNLDSVTLTPYQLKYWRIFYTPVPEGAIAPNLVWSGKDTLEVGEPLSFAVAFKNISKAAFDSLRIKVNILDQNNVQHVVTLPMAKPIITGDTVVVRFNIDTRDYQGHNVMYLDFNPDNDQPEQHHFNNFLFHNFYVRPDKMNPLLDVTFDGVHILNRDIVSAKPHIVIKLKDEAKYMLLNDTSLSSVQVKYPDGTLRSFSFDNDTLRFIPASSGADNTASIDFYPHFTTQYSPEGDEYELIVKGKDRSGNKAGEIEYRVTFKVIAKPMISNLLNYPNPFSTSTAFVFTITGSEIPQNIKIQILTVTGKIVREITKDELGPLHIGRNITEFKWDGTDQYGQKLGNGVYLYRVVTTLNGKSMEKYKAEGDNTDKFFTNGYGKMYLMR
jgi:hypothetical protein